MSKFMKSLCKIAIPVTLQSMLQASFSIVDQIMIRQLGETNISAVGLCGIAIKKYAFAADAQTAQSMV